MTKVILSCKTYILDIGQPIPCKLFDKIILSIPVPNGIDKEIEIWRDVVGYDRYMVSNLGNIWSKSHDRELVKDKKMDSGYCKVKMYDGNKICKKRSIHILVAKAFILDNDPENGPRVVDHIDRNRMNNCADNLRWITKSGNSQSYHDNFRNKREILQFSLDNKLIREWNGINEILKDNPTYNKGTLQKSMNGHIIYGYQWKYKFDKPKPNANLEEGEIFKIIGIFKDRDFSKYEVSNYGKVRHIENGNILSPAIQDTGYHKVILMDKKSRKYNIKIHIIVAHVFVPKPEGKFVDRPDHIDRNKLNNYYKNLEWVDAEGNAIRAQGKKVNQLDISTNEVIKTFDSVASAQRAIGRSHSMGIIRCCQGKRPTAYGYKWTYV
jgi:hypothetical protein